MLRLLSDMVKNGGIGRLDVINIAGLPDEAQEAQVRSVPTMLLGQFRLTGAHSLSEIQEWIDKSNSETGLIDYLNQSFDQGELEQITEQARQDNSLLPVMLDMLAEPETPITSRIGISAVLESFSGQAPLQNLIDAICKHAQSKNASVRVDMAHLLGLSHSRDALACLQTLSEDKFADVQETAKEAIEEIEVALEN